MCGIIIGLCDWWWRRKERVWRRCVCGRVLFILCPKQRERERDVIYVFVCFFGRRKNSASRLFFFSTPNKHEKNVFFISHYYYSSSQSHTHKILPNIIIWSTEGRAAVPVHFTTSTTSTSTTMMVVCIISRVKITSHNETAWGASVTTVSTHDLVLEKMSIQRSTLH